MGSCWAGFTAPSALSTRPYGFRVAQLETQNATHGVDEAPTDRVGLSHGVLETALASLILFNRLYERHTDRGHETTRSAMLRAMV